MAVSTTQNRKPQGVPRGGEWAPGSKQEAGGEVAGQLAAWQTPDVDDRVEQHVSAAVEKLSTPADPEDVFGAWADRQTQAVQAVVRSGGMPAVEQVSEQCGLPVDDLVGRLPPGRDRFAMALQAAPPLPDVPSLGDRECLVVVDKRSDEIVVTDMPGLDEHDNWAAAPANAFAGHVRETLTVEGDPSWDDRAAGEMLTVARQLDAVDDADKRTGEFRLLAESVPIVVDRFTPAVRPRDAAGVWAQAGTTGHQIAQVEDVMADQGNEQAMLTCGMARAGYLPAAEKVAGAYRNIDWARWEADQSSM